MVFPGTWSETDCYEAVTDNLGQSARYVWHKETDLSGLDCIVLPGGFSYGDYLRPGAIAKFSPVMESVAEFASEGKPVIGICNGFQILCESGLLPGVLRQNDHLEFRCEWVDLKVENVDSTFSNLATKGQVLGVPISHGDGNYYAPDDVIEQLEAQNRVIFRYSTPEGEITQPANPNGSINNIAGIINEAGNVLGMMPHPERCCDPLLGGTDGLVIFQSIVDSALAVSSEKSESR